MIESTLLLVFAAIFMGVKYSRGTEVTERYFPWDLLGLLLSIVFQRMSTWQHVPGATRMPRAMVILRVAVIVYGLLLAFVKFGLSK